MANSRSRSRGKRNPARPKRKPKKSYAPRFSTELIVTIFIALFPVGWSMLELPKTQLVGALCWLFCVGLSLHVILGRMRWKSRPLQVASAAAVVILFGSLVVWALTRNTKPDVNLEISAIIDPRITLPSVIVRNDSDVLARDIKYAVYLVNPNAFQTRDRPPVSTFHRDLKEWLRPHSHMDREPCITPMTWFQTFQQGDKILGFAYISCAECLTTRTYWIAIDSGVEGWYVEARPEFAANEESFGRLWPELAKDKEKF